jgi:hypothetical protein
LAAALRYFAGCSVYDIALIHGISVTEVHQSIWQVVNAVNNCSKLKFEFLKDLAAQQKLLLDLRKTVVRASLFVLGPSMDSWFGLRSHLLKIVSRQSVAQRKSSVWVQEKVLPQHAGHL